MTMDTIVQAARTFGVMAQMVSGEDLTAAKHAIAMADAAGAVLDPTAYIVALQTGSLDRQRKLLAWFDDSRRALADIFPDAKEVFHVR